MVKFDKEIMDIVKDDNWMASNTRSTHIFKEANKTLCGRYYAMPFLVSIIEYKGVLCRKCLKKRFDEEPKIIKSKLDAILSTKVNDASGIFANKYSRNIITTLHEVNCSYVELFPIAHYTSKLAFYIRKLKKYNLIELQSNKKYRLTTKGELYYGILKLLEEINTLSIEELNEIHRDIPKLLKIPNDFEELKNIIREVIKEDRDK